MTTLLAALLVLVVTASAATFDRSHAQLERVLKQHVSDGRVSYAALKKDRNELDTYLRTAGSVAEEEFKKWPKNEQIAFLINLYNAATLQLIIDHYPVKSIKDTGKWFKTPWELDAVTLFGGRTTLDHIEHGLLRPGYNEPRIHFALVCAARSCPPLRSEAYVAPRLDEQLDAQGRTFLRLPGSHRVDSASRTVFLSPIFKWFRADFEARSGSVLKFVTPYFPPEDQKILASSGEWKMRFTSYNWDLNDARGN